MDNIKNDRTTNENGHSINGETKKEAYQHQFAYFQSLVLINVVRARSIPRGFIVFAKCACVSRFPLNEHFESFYWSISEIWYVESIGIMCSRFVILLLRPHSIETFFWTKRAKCFCVFDINILFDISPTRNLLNWKSKMLTERR